MKKQLKKLLMIRMKQFKDSTVTECELIKYHWFNRKFSSRLTKLNNGKCINTTYDLTNNCKAFEFEFNLNDFNSAQKVVNDIIIFIKDEEVEKLCKILYTITSLS